MKKLIKVLFPIFYFGLNFCNEVFAQRNFLSLDIGNKYLYSINYERDFSRDDSSGKYVNGLIGFGFDPWVNHLSCVSSTVKFNPFNKAKRLVFECGLIHVLNRDYYTRKELDSIQDSDPLFFKRVKVNPHYQLMGFLSMGFQFLKLKKCSMVLFANVYLINDRKYYNTFSAIPYGGINLSFPLK